MAKRRYSRAWTGGCGVRRGLVTMLVIVGLVGGLMGVTAATALGQSGQSDGVPGIGDVVPFVGTEGSTLAEITIDAVEDPFQDYDPSVTPERAYHFVLLTITVTNTGSRPFAFDSNAIAVQDGEGFLARPLYLPRAEASLAALPDYAAGEVPSGETVSGALAFQILNGTEARTVVYLPANDRLVVLASLPGASAPATAGPTTSDTGPGTDAGADTSDTTDAPDAATPDAAGTDAAEMDAASSLDCALAETWATDTGARLDTVSLLVEELETFDRETADPVRLGEIAEEFQALADDQASSETPPELDAANDGFVDAFEAFAAAFDVVAQAADDGDIDAVADAANADVATANTVLTDAAGLAQAELAAYGLD